MATVYESLGLENLPADAPLPWTACFSESRSVSIPSRTNTGDADTFKVYLSQSESPTTVFVMHHGAGYSALTWALTVKFMRTFVSRDHFDILCYDCRGHGTSKTTNDEDLSIDTLSDDLVNVVNAVYPEGLPPQIMLVGHSMGGAVVVDVASKKKLGRNVMGVVMIDVVEGTALESLKHMRSILFNRPKSFASLESAIRWSVDSRTIHNMISARISVPSQLVESRNRHGETEYVWRVNLMRSERYWEGWFTDLSSKFLASPAAKLLILAGTDRLDKTLTIGQMQGKFQMIVVPVSGHVVQEDLPDKMAKIIVEFWNRNQPLKEIKRFPIPPLKPAAENKKETEHALKE